MYSRSLSLRLAISTKLEIVIDISWMGWIANWTEVSSDRRLANYTTLPAGRYTFRVQAATSQGSWGNLAWNSASRFCPRGGARGGSECSAPLPQLEPFGWSILSDLSK